MDHEPDRMSSLGMSMSDVEGLHKGDDEKVAKFFQKVKEYRVTLNHFSFWFLICDQ